MVPIFIGLAVAYLLSEDDGLDQIIKRVGTWAPDEYDDEKGFRKDLTRHLRKSRRYEEEFYIIEEWAYSRSRTDICVEGCESENKVYIELKYQLNSSNELNRLLGQVLRVDKHIKLAIICLLEPDESIYDELRRTLKRHPTLNEKVMIEVWDFD